MFPLFLTSLVKVLAKARVTTPKQFASTKRQFRDKLFSRSHLYEVLFNPIYIGKITHHEKTNDGQHPAIIDQTTWEAVQTLMKSNHQGERKRKSAPSASLLLGLVKNDVGHRLVPSHSQSQRQSKRSRYYISEPLNKTSRGDESTVLKILNPNGNQVQPISATINNTKSY